MSLRTGARMGGLAVLGGEATVSRRDNGREALGRATATMNGKPVGVPFKPVKKINGNAHSASYSRAPRCLPLPSSPSVSAHPALATSVTSPSDCSGKLHSNRDSGFFLIAFRLAVSFRCRFES